MNVKRIGMITVMVASLMFGACVNLKQPRNKISFYTLEYAEPAFTEKRPLPFVLKLERFSVAPFYNTSQIVYREKSFEREHYAYHRWRANPADLTTYFIGRDIRSSGLFNGVLSPGSGSRSSHLIEGSVDEFLEQDSPSGWKATLAIGITLIKQNEPDISRRVILDKVYREARECSEKNPRALAEAMSKAMKSVSERIIKDIYAALSTS